MKSACRIVRPTLLLRSNASGDADRKAYSNWDRGADDRAGERAGFRGEFIQQLPVSRRRPDHRPDHTPDEPAHEDEKAADDEPVGEGLARRGLVHPRDARTSC
jgi:hypothetical protein